MYCPGDQVDVVAAQSCDPALHLLQVEIGQVLTIADTASLGQGWVWCKNSFHNEGYVPASTLRKVHPTSSDLVTNSSEDHSTATHGDSEWDDSWDDGDSEKDSSVLASSGPGQDYEGNDPVLPQPLPGYKQKYPSPTLPTPMEEGISSSDSRNEINFQSSLPPVPGNEENLAPAAPSREGYHSFLPPSGPSSEGIHRLLPPSGSSSEGIHRLLPPSGSSSKESFFRSHQPSQTDQTGVQDIDDAVYWKVAISSRDQTFGDFEVAPGDLVRLIQDADHHELRKAFVESLKTGVRGHVPETHIFQATALDNKPWFVGMMSRKDAEARLRAGGVSDDTFLVRESSNLSGFVLSIKTRHPGNFVEIRHRRVAQRGVKYYAWQGFEFISIEALVKAHRTAEGGNCLKNPYNKYEFSNF